MVDDTVYAYISDHEESAVESILPVLSCDPVIRAVVKAFGREVQDLEDALFSLVYERFLTTAQGVGLDQIGRVVGEAREGLTDPEYRKVLAARLLVNRSSGEPERIIQIAKLLTNATSVHARPLPPMRISLEVELEGINSIPEETEPRIKSMILEALSAGVGLDSIIEGDNTVFRLDTEGQGLDEGLLARTIL